MSETLVHHSFTQYTALMMNVSNVTTLEEGLEPGSDDPSDDAVWILSSTFIIFTMQSGFGLLESGSVTTKNEVNIMVKNAVDVIVGGCTYWAFGYALSFGDESWSNPFCGWGLFFVETDVDKFGQVFSHFFFQASFATTATTIVSGAMAERTKLEAYIVFSALNTLVYCFPAHWVWSSNGWLKTLGVIDVAGDGPVHLVGGVTGLVATLMLKPRHCRYDRKTPPQMGSPTNALLGMFMLWWGWLGFNCGSTFGISGMKWKLAARSAVATLCSSVGGGTMGLLLSYIFKKRQIDVGYLINSILGALVAITGMCAFAQPWEGVVIGAVGAVLSLSAIETLNKLKVDDPVGCVGVHAVGGAWGLLAAGLFSRPDHLRPALLLSADSVGLLWGGSAHLLGIQMMAVVVISAWTALMSFIFLKVISLTVGLRMSLQHEILGADLVEHAVGHTQYDKTKVVRKLGDSSEDSFHEINEALREHRRPLFGLRMTDAVQSRHAHFNEDNTSLPMEEREINSNNSYRLSLPEWRLAFGSPTRWSLRERRSTSRVIGKYIRRAKSLSFRVKARGNPLKDTNFIMLRDLQLVGLNESHLQVGAGAQQAHDNQTFTTEEEGPGTQRGACPTSVRPSNGFQRMTKEVLLSNGKTQDGHSSYFDMANQDTTSVHM